MRDLIFLVIVLGFFAVAVLFVRGCELILGAREGVEEARRP
jgi:hypothetical protein